MIRQTLVLALLLWGHTCAIGQVAGVKLFDKSENTQPSTPHANDQAVPIGVAETEKRETTYVASRFC